MLAFRTAIYGILSRPGVDKLDCCNIFSIITAVKSQVVSLRSKSRGFRKVVGMGVGVLTSLGRNVALRTLHFS